MTTIIAATDLTERSAGVLGRAAVIARTTGAALIPVHVMPDGSAVAQEVGAEELLRAELAQLPDGIRIAEIRILQGRPEVVLPDLAEAEGAALLVLGLHRPRRVLDLLRLTTMERIVLNADVPVLIARNGPAGPYRCVLASTDFAPACARALAAAATIAPDAEFHAIHALRQDLRDKFGPGDIGDSRAMTQAEILRSAFVIMPGVPASLHLPEIIPGGVHEVVAFRLDELRPDLLAIGTHSGRVPGAIGNYARDFMRDPPTDVLVAKPPAT